MWSEKSSNVLWLLILNTKDVKFINAVMLKSNHFYAFMLGSDLVNYHWLLMQNLSLISFTTWPRDPFVAFNLSAYSSEVCSQEQTKNNKQKNKNPEVFANQQNGVGRTKLLMG